MQKEFISNEMVKELAKRACEAVKNKNAREEKAVASAVWSLSREKYVYYLLVLAELLRKRD